MIRLLKEDGKQMASVDYSSVPDVFDRQNSMNGEKGRNGSLRASEDDVFISCNNQHPKEALTQFNCQTHKSIDHVTKAPQVNGIKTRRSLSNDDLESSSNTSSGIETKTQLIVETSVNFVSLVLRKLISEQLVDVPRIIALNREQVERISKIVQEKRPSKLINFIEYFDLYWFIRRLEVNSTFLFDRVSFEQEGCNRQLPCSCTPRLLLRTLIP